jgi:hypothetical protein
LFLDTGVGTNVFVPLRAFDDESRARLHHILDDAGLSPNRRAVERPGRRRRR